MLHLLFYETVGFIKNKHNCIVKHQFIVPVCHTKQYLVKIAGFSRKKTIANLKPKGNLGLSATSVPSFLHPRCII